MNLADYKTPVDGFDIGQAITSILLHNPVITVPPGEYIQTTPINLPVLSGRVTPRQRFLLDGVTFRSQGCESSFRRRPATMRAALNSMETHVPIIQGGSFWDFSGAAIDICGTYNAVIEDALFYNCGMAIRAAFCLNAAINRCMATAFTQAGFVACSAAGDGFGNVLIPDSNGMNSCSNMAHFFKCRTWSNKWDADQFVIVASDSVKVEQCIAEGPACRANVRFDAWNSPVLRRFMVQDFHAECSNSSVIFDLDGGPYIAIDGVDRGSLPGRLIRWVGGVGSMSINDFSYGLGWQHKAWTQKQYGVGVRVAHAGKQWACTSPTTTEPGTSGDWLDEGDSSGFFGERLTSYKRVHITNSHDSLRDIPWTVGGLVRSPNLCIEGVYGDKEYRSDYSTNLVINTKSGTTQL